ncbi:MAG: double-strand break repair helicase AddA [Hyphomicrobiales bacterium]|nr:double-strand break repair helicase AddA [Hyphomicrobiales bacterium]
MSVSPIRGGPTPDQTTASDPAHSAWVSASAGSGKTFVLARRVLRLLRRGVDPGRILCLTFTRAAAAEMAKRVFADLGKWATMSDKALVKELADLERRPPQPEDLNEARKLFARALETPGGIKIQTIHAFAERVLHQFPFEANVAAHFDVLDEATAADLQDRAEAAVIAGAARDSGGPLAAALDTLASFSGEIQFSKLVSAVVSERETLRRWIREQGDLDAALDDLAMALGVDPNDDPAALKQSIANSPLFPPSDWPAAIDALMSSGAKTDADRAGDLARALAAGGEARSEAYQSVFFTGQGKPRTRLMTKTLADAHPDLAVRLADEHERLAAIVEQLRSQEAHAASAALFRLADAVLDRYAALKQARGLLDYDDLIAKTHALLTRVEAAQWVLYKLDGGIDHILIDEAQDTSPQQWEIVRMLAEEGLAGEGAREAERTLFAVGDEKQSIYSFQGADPVKFDEMRRYFERRVGEAGRPWARVPLTVSFRSGPAVLEAVDRVFAAPEAREGLAAGATPVVHEPVRDKAPGLVELWAPETAEPRTTPDPWDAPLDRFDSESPRARLAIRIAATIAGWRTDKTLLQSQGRPIAPGDILILVRRRNEFVDALVAALRAKNIPVAGADRLVLRDHIAVMDLLAAADVALLPEDDLSLATVLKSPLVGLDEERLFALCANRTGTLWQALEAGRAEAPYPDAFAFVSQLRARADFGPPFAFFAAVLGPMKGRRKLLSRLGPEAADALDEFLNLALAYERGAAASLQGFVQWMRGQSADIKRNMEQAKGEVRIMTVHGAKGLEAPIVFLPDTCEVPGGRHDGPLFTLEAPSRVPGAAAPLVWAPGKQETQPQAVQAARERVRAAQMAEYRRLLYVAMTRAEDCLYVCGAQATKTLPEGCWYELIANALRPVLTPLAGKSGEEPVAWQFARGTAAAAGPFVAEEAEPEEELPNWARRPAPQPGPAAIPLIPSAMIEAGEERGPQHLGTEAATRAAALARGNLIHRLLERLPEVAAAARPQAALQLLQRFAPELADAERRQIAEEVLALIGHVDLAPLFGPDSRAEVSIGGPIGRDAQSGRPIMISGQIDRLVVREDAVLIADFKTNRQVPASAGEAPRAYVAQLAAYRAALQKLFPGKTIEALIIWTAGPVAMPMPGALLDQAVKAHDRVNAP